MFRNLRVSNRLALLVVVFVILLIAIGIFTLVQMRNIAESLDEVTADHVVTIINTNALQAAMLELSVTEKNHFLASDGTESAQLDQQLQNQRTAIQNEITALAPYIAD